MRRPSTMRHVETNENNNLKVKKEKERRTSLADLIPDWPVLTQRKKVTKVITVTLTTAATTLCLPCYS